MGFLIKLTHKQNGQVHYLAAVPIECVPIEDREPDTDFQIYPFKTLEEAKEFSFPTAEAAANIPFTLDTKNIDYEVVDVGEDESSDDVDSDEVAEIESEKKWEN